MGKDICKTGKTRPSATNGGYSVTWQGNRSGFIPEQGRQGYAGKKTAQNHLPLVLLHYLLAISCLLLLSHPVKAEQVVLDQLHFDHIKFKRVKPNTVTFHDGTISFEVNETASFMLHAFEDARSVSRVAFDWKANGKLNKRDVEHETTRKGDDAWLRVGLILKGEPQLLDPLVPSWVKQVRNTLKYPSDEMVYLVPDARHAPGKSWPSPFSKQIRMISVASSTEKENGWRSVNYVSPQPLQVIGIWLMADGDNTQSSFRSSIRKLQVQ